MMFVALVLIESKWNVNKELDILEQVGVIGFNRIKVKCKCFRGFVIEPDTKSFNRIKVKCKSPFHSLK